MKKNVYLPDERTIFPRINNNCKTNLESKDDNDLPENIVVNNIAYQEFDYTEKE